MSRYYEFKREDAENFKTHVGAMARNFGEEMIFAYCPYCKGGRHIFNQHKNRSV